MAEKQIRTIIGLVCKVEFPCGCHAIVAQGGRHFRDNWKVPMHFVSHSCPDWKKHKRELAAAERNLALRMIEFRRPSVALGYKLRGKRALEQL